jgi:hypothetical protein
MLMVMKSSRKLFFLGAVIGAALCGGCLSQYKALANRPAVAPNLPQLVRFYSVQQVRLKTGSLFISGTGSASADGGKNTLTKPTPLSSYPAIQMTIKRGNTGELETCLKQVQDVEESLKSIDIRGMGTYTIESVIDPPLDTGVFMLTKLDACGSAVFSNPVSTPTVSTATAPAGQGAISAADLVAVPERFLDRKVVITGHMPSPVQFMDPVSRLIIESEGQSLSGYFLTPTLAAESRLLLVHATPGSVLTLEGTLTRITPTSLAAQSGVAAAAGYEFDVSNLLSIASASH